MQKSERARARARSLARWHGWIDQRIRRSVRLLSFLTNKQRAVHIFFCAQKLNCNIIVNEKEEEEREREMFKRAQTTTTTIVQHSDIWLSHEIYVGLVCGIWDTNQNVYICECIEQSIQTYFTISFKWYLLQKKGKKLPRFYWNWKDECRCNAIEAREFIATTNVCYSAAHKKKTEQKFRPKTKRRVRLSVCARYWPGSHFYNN